MPEGPEIRRAADRLARVLVNQRLAGIESHLPQIAGLEKRLGGATVERIAPHGKAMLIHFDNDLTLYSHNQLYGRWYVTRRGRPPRTRRQLRVALHTATHSALLYSATDIELLDAGALASHPFLTRLGPDILDEELTVAAIGNRLADPVFKGRSLAALYLDQSFLAGVGNYLRSEILWAARLDPRRRPRELKSAERTRLARQTLTISRRAYRQRGITVTKTLYRALKAEGLRHGQCRFQAYGRDEMPCRRCDHPIERTELAGRSLYFCAGCQS